ncbi:MAG: hypothetical protein V1913_11895, partial [Fibrobacterota bacterium]
MSRFFGLFIVVTFGFLAGYYTCHKKDLFSFSEASHAVSRPTAPASAVAVPVGFFPDAGAAVRRNNAMVQAVQKASASVVFIGVTQIRIVNNPVFDDP